MNAFARQTIYHSAASTTPRPRSGLYGGWLEAARVLQFGPLSALDVADMMETAPKRAADILADMAAHFVAHVDADGLYALSSKGRRRMLQAEHEGR